MIRTCIIGVSGFAAAHYNDLLGEVKSGRMQASGATVINPSDESEKCAKLRELDCMIFDDYRAMLDDLGSECDLCLIPTGLPWHARMTCDAFRASMNVLVEKPAAPTIQEVRAMQEAEAESGRFAAVGYQHIYNPAVQAIKGALLEGLVGELHTLKAWGIWPRNDAYYSRNDWAGRLREGPQWVLDSPFNNALAHYLNLLCFFAGNRFDAVAQPVTIQAELYRAHRIESCDTACMRIATGEGPTLYFYATHCGRAQSEPVLELQGDRGVLTWDMGRQPSIQRRGCPSEPIPGIDFRLSRKDILDHVEWRINDPGAFICTLEMAASQTLCANGAHESSAIHTIPEKYLRREEEAGSVWTHVEGLDEILMRAKENDALFSEMGAPWAQPERSIDLRNYGAFPATGSI